MWDPNDYIKTRLLFHKCASDTEIRTASQKSTVKQADPVCVKILVGECSLLSNYLVQSSFLFDVGTAFPHLLS